MVLYEMTQMPADGKLYQKRRLAMGTKGRKNVKKPKQSKGKKK
jgi:hypothetical protein